MDYSCRLFYFSACNAVSEWWLGRDSFFRVDVLSFFSFWVFPSLHFGCFRFLILFRFLSLLSAFLFDHSFLSFFGVQSSFPAAPGLEVRSLPSFFPALLLWALSSRRRRDSLRHISRPTSLVPIMPCSFNVVLEDERCTHARTHASPPPRAHCPLPTAGW